MSLSWFRSDGFVMAAVRAGLGQLLGDQLGPLVAWCMRGRTEYEVNT